MADILEDIDRAMRQEQMETFWQQNGRKVVIGVAALLVATGAWSGFRAWKDSADAMQTEKIVMALDKADPVADLEAAAKGGLDGAHRAVALLSAAGSLTMKDAPAEKRIALYGQVADDRNTPVDLREFAELARLRLQADQTGADGAAIASKLEMIAKNARSPWRYQAQMDLAVVTAHLRKDYAAARTALKPLLDAKDLPPGLKETAQMLDRVYAARSAPEASPAAGDEKHDQTETKTNTKAKP